MEQHTKSLACTAAIKSVNQSPGFLIKKRSVQNSRYHIIHLLFILLVSLPMLLKTQSLTAQKNKSNRNSDQQTIKLLCHQWYIDNKNALVQKGYFPVDSIATIDFFTNGYAKFKTTRTLDAVWNYDFTRHNLFIILEGKISKYKILSLSGTSLVLENTAGKKTTKVNLFRTAQ